MKKCCSYNNLRIVCESDENGNVTQFYECSKCHRRYKEINLNFYGKTEELQQEKLKKYLKTHPRYRVVRENKIFKNKKQKENCGLSVGVIKKHYA